MRKVIVNSTPLIALSKVQRLELLKDLYEEITIPQAVFDEVTSKNDDAKSALLVKPWIHVEKVRSDADRRMYSSRLHSGEVEVMMLAREYPQEHLVVIDDGAARKTAEFLGLHLTGTIGILIKAKELGKIDAVMPIIEKMESSGIYFSMRLKNRVGRIARERFDAKLDLANKLAGSVHANIGGDSDPGRWSTTN